MILEVLLGLKSKQGHITAAFVHANVEEGESIYTEMPHGFKQIFGLESRLCLGNQASQG